MSGPKRTSYRISQRLYEQQKRERNQNRVRQINEITIELKQCTTQIQQIINQHGRYANHVSDRVENWMGDVNVAINGDLRDAWRGLKGIKNYLNKEGLRLNKNAEGAKQRQKAREKNLQEARKKAEQREVEKQKFANEVSEKLESVKIDIESLQNEFGERVNEVLKQPNVWISEAEREIDNNPKMVVNTIKGVENYLKDKKKEINNIRQKLIKEEKVNRIVESLKSIEENYPEIINPGIQQRIDLFTQSIGANPENQTTLKQIDDFKQNIIEKVETAELEKENKKYVADTFAEILDTTVEKDEKGGDVINGNIEGVPITVRLNDKDNQINMDTPTDGSCRKGLEALQKKLALASIDLGEIKILNTGQTLNQKQRTTMKRRLDA